MVENAVAFKDIAEAIETFTHNRILVAHNAHFDYTFLKHAFRHVGKIFQRKTLCTLRLSRKIVPGLPSYALDNLCRSLKILQRPVHRAESDAIAALEVFKYLQQSDKDGVIGAFLTRRSAEFTYPPNLPVTALNNLPDAAGVYYFRDARGKVLYVGKAKSIKHRVSSHFTGTSSTRARTKLMNHIHEIGFELCGNELVAMLLESSEIKKYFPPFNYAQKITDNNFGIYCYEDGKGYLRFGTRKLKGFDRPLVSFPSLSEARIFLSEKVTEFQLCPKLCGLQRSLHECFDHDSGKCDGACCGKIDSVTYNHRMEEAVKSFKADSRSYAIIGNGRSADECSVVVLEDGKYLGFGFMEKERVPESFHSLKDSIQHLKDNREVQTIIQSWLKKNNDYRVVFA
jgi:DNA polymerase-3 subunit epsilon